jgi:DNA primase
VEGPFDAIAIDGISAMTNDVNEIQATRIKNLAKPVIVVPDRDLAGSKFIDTALKYQWSISCPNWEPQVKDCADAVLKYGRIYTLLSIVKNIVDNPIKQQVIQKQLANR